MKQYISNNFKQDISNKYNKIYVLTEQGCLPCNTKFTKFVANKINEDSTLIIVNASGVYVDISEFLDKKENIFFTKQSSNDSLFNTSKILFLKNNQLDTIIYINPSKLQSQFEYIERY
jgi:hypothetical protein